MLSIKIPLNEFLILFFTDAKVDGRNAYKKYAPSTRPRKLISRSSSAFRSMSRWLIIEIDSCCFD